MIKKKNPLIKLEMEGNFLNLKKGTSEKPTAKILFSHLTLNAFLLQLGIKINKEREKEREEKEGRTKCHKD